MSNYLVPLVLLSQLLLACSTNAPAPVAQEISQAVQSTAPITASETNNITVYKSPTCGCCSEWEDHLRMSGFNVTSIKRRDMQTITQRSGVHSKLASCHTALIDGYVIEGHVPAKDIQRLLQERPNVKGLTAPGMPQESPGMQAHGKEPKNYDVLSFDAAGNTTVFSAY